MRVQGFTFEDAVMERSPGQDGEVYAGNLVDERDGGPVTLGYGRYGPNAELTETMAVDDVMIIVQGELSVTSRDTTIRAAVGAVVHMPRGETVTIRAGAGGAVTAYVTYPHWRAAGA
jgi:ethanolamine utilization protein EutQ (cupin superfamily)